MAKSTSSLKFTKGDILKDAVKFNAHFRKRDLFIDFTDLL